MGASDRSGRVPLDPKRMHDDFAEGQRTFQRDERTGIHGDFAVGQRTLPRVERRVNVPAMRQLDPKILWLNDAPMFIDEDQIRALYNAILRPEFGRGTVTLSEGITQDTTVGGELTLGSAIPWAKANASASLERKTGRLRGQQVTLLPIDNAHRQLYHLVLYYADAYRDRMRMVSAGIDPESKAMTYTSSPATPAWNEPRFISPSPRALVFMDLPPETRFLPTALELSEGKIRKLYEKLAKQFAEGAGEPAPDYPGSGSDTATEEAREKYWTWFRDHFDDRAALKTIEEESEGGRIQWIDYRVFLGTEKPFLHLHVNARGRYDVGTFAYNLVARGKKHGVRLVGTLKTEPDMNVLAIFDK
jgi:hypothetical protein